MWIKHPRSKEPDAMLTLAVVAFVSVVLKFLTNDVVLGLGEKSVSLGKIDATLVGALLAPTLGAYVIRKQKDSPIEKEKL